MNTLQDAWHDLLLWCTEATSELEDKVEEAQQALIGILDRTDVMSSEWNEWVPQDETAERQIRFRTWYGSQLHYIHESLQELTRLKLGEPSVEGLTALVQENNRSLEPLGAADHDLRATTAELVHSIAQIVESEARQVDVVDATSLALGTLTEAAWRWAVYSAEQVWQDEDVLSEALKALDENGAEIWPAAEAASQRLEWIEDEVPPKEDSLYWGWLFWGDDPQSDLDSKQQLGQRP